MSNVPGGPPCPACGARDSEVKDSRSPKTVRYTYRRRYCPCGNRFTTIEISDTEYQRISRLARRLQEIKEALDEPT